MPGALPDLPSLLAELDALVGLAPVKAEIRSLLERLQLERWRDRVPARPPDDPIATTTTDGTGTYAFTGVDGGAYRLFADEPGTGRWVEAVGFYARMHSFESEHSILIAAGAAAVLFGYSTTEERFDIFGLGSGGNYSLFRRADGTWAPPRNLGPPVSSEFREFDPFNQRSRGTIPEALILPLWEWVPGEEELCALLGATGQTDAVVEGVHFTAETPPGGGSIFIQH